MKSFEKVPFEKGLSSAGLKNLQPAEIERKPDYGLVCCRFHSSNNVISWPELNYAVAAEVFAGYPIERLQFITRKEGVVVGVRGENIISVNLDNENFDPSFVRCDKDDNAEIYCIRTASNWPYCFPYQYLQEICSEVYSSSYRKAALTPCVRNVLVYFWDRSTH